MKPTSLIKVAGSLISTDFISTVFGYALHLDFRMVSFILKEGVPFKDPKLYTKDDFEWSMDNRNGYKSSKPLICALEAEYHPDGSIKGYVRDKMYDPLVQGVPKVYQKESKMWTQKKKMLLTTHSSAPDRSIASSCSSGSCCCLSGSGIKCIPIKGTKSLVAQM